MPASLQGGISRPTASHDQGKHFSTCMLRNVQAKGAHCHMTGCLGRVIRIAAIETRRGANGTVRISFDSGTTNACLATGTYRYRSPCFLFGLLSMREYRLTNLSTRSRTHCGNFLQTSLIMQVLATAKIGDATASSNKRTTASPFLQTPRRPMPDDWAQSAIRSMRSSWIRSPSKMKTLCFSGSCLSSFALPWEVESGAIITEVYAKTTSPKNRERRLPTQSIVCYIHFAAEFMITILIPTFNVPPVDSNIPPHHSMLQ